jgi:glycosyltransferase involved in cell wall biosynthesis
MKAVPPAGSFKPARRLLMVARDFPHAATSGALRAASFARYLPEHGWTTTVITIRRSFHGFADANLEQALPPDCRIFEAFGFDTKTVFSWRGRYPAILAFPDREASWIAGGIRQALRACRETCVDAILSTSPAVSAHAIALMVGRITGLPWIAELRDPWNLDAPRGAFLRRLDRRLERLVLRAADAVVVVTPGHGADLAREHGSEVGDKVRLLPNGYDEDAMTPLLASAPPATPFTVVHVGSCLPTYRDPFPFLRAVRICLDRNDLPADVSIELVGTPMDATLTDEVARLGLGAWLRLRGRVSHREALTVIARASLLLMLQTRPEHDRSIPAKAYEYLRTDRTILAIARDGSETEQLMRGYDGVLVAPPGDAEAIARALAQAHRAWRADPGHRFVRSVAHYSRRRVATDLARLLDELRATAMAGTA